MTLKIRLQPVPLVDQVMRWREIEKAASHLLMHGRDDGERGSAPKEDWERLIASLAHRHFPMPRVVEEEMA